MQHLWTVLISNSMRIRNTLIKPSTIDRILNQREITATIAALVTLSFVASPAFAQIDIGNGIGAPNSGPSLDNNTSISNSTASAPANNTSTVNSTTPNHPKANGTSMLNATTTANLANNMLNLGKPSFIEHNIGTNKTTVNENTTRVTFVGVGTLMLSDGKNVTTSDHGRAVIYSTEGYSRAYGHVTLRIPDSNEDATVTFVEFVPSNATVGIGTAYIESNSTGQLAGLNGMIGVFRDEMNSNTSTIRFWNWQ